MKQNDCLLHLARIMEKYNELPNLYHHALFHYSLCIEETADEAIKVLEKLVSKSEIRTCRVPLVIDFENMPKLDYWLSCKIFNDLDAQSSRALKEKFMLLTNLLRQLKLLKKKVDPKRAMRFFRLMMARVKENEYILDYEIWRADPNHLTIDQLWEQEVRLTAKLLSMGVLDYDSMPSGAELENVRLDLVMKGLEYGTILPKDFEIAAAKVRRYSYWAEELFMIDYPRIYNELYQYCFEKFTEEQRRELFEYDMQLRMIHEDMVKVKPELAKYLNTSREVKIERTQYVEVIKVAPETSVTYIINKVEQINGNIDHMHLAHADVAVGVAEEGSNVYHHKNN